VKRRTRLVLIVLTSLLVLAAIVILTVEGGPGSLSGRVLTSDPMTHAHSHLDGQERLCSKCHVTLGQEVSEELCLDCHTSLATRIKNKTGFHSKVEAECGECHKEHLKADYAIIQWPTADGVFKPVRSKDGKQEAFPHEPATGFPLAGAHEPLDCGKCHTNELLIDADVVSFKLSPDEGGAKPTEGGPTHWGTATLLGLATTCGGCHQDPHVPGLGDECAKCHGEKSWEPAKDFDHSKTRYALEGKHADKSVVGCKDCHLAPPATSPPPLPPPPLPTFKALAAEVAPRPFRGQGFGKAPAIPVQGETLPGCVACHENVHRKQSKAFQDCESCHTPAEWDMAASATFDHDKTDFVLRGKHKNNPEAKCADCHGKQPKPQRLDGPVKRTCVECHSKDDDKAHQGGFDREMALKSKSCDLCHTEETWESSTYTAAKHLQDTEIALSDKHGGKCEDCHGRGASLMRFSKPKQPWTRVKIPRLPPEPGGRVSVGPLEKSCAACHGAAHDGRFERELGKGCLDCHDYKQWHLAELDNAGHAKLGFPIVDAHADKKVTCESCHSGRTAEGGLKELSLREVRVQGCVVCHEDPHEKQLGTKCADCHTEKVFDPSTYTEAAHTKTRLPLRDGHRAVPCSVCHVRNITPRWPPKNQDAKVKAQRFKWPERGREVACSRCHEDPHAGQFKQSCSACHGEQHFVPSTFEVEAGHKRIGFPLEGSHKTDCARCHVSGLKHGKAVTYGGTPKACAGCHLDVHLGQFENKRLGCQTCHVIANWKPDRFDHDKCRFSLAGAHSRVACADCHLSSQRTFPDGKKRKVVHYYPIEKRDCGDCHVNPHAQSVEKTPKKGGKKK
jgi:hypothetical protein